MMMTMIRNMFCALLIVQTYAAASPREAVPDYFQQWKSHQLKVGEHACYKDTSTCKGFKEKGGFKILEIKENHSAPEKSMVTVSGSGMTHHVRKSEIRPQVRVRFAPSPTGDLHMGSAFIAYINWLCAKKYNGTFILRIEDTSARRNKKGSVESIKEGLKWLGLNWDEGPDAHEEKNEYFQSKRNDIYQKYLKKLKDAGRIYTKDNGEIWFRTKKEPQTYRDIAKGKCITQTQPEDFILCRDDGSVKFHLANVVDDITMGITHILRGSDKVDDGDMGKHLDLMKACGAPFIPHYGHLPLIMKPDGSGKLSKREGGCVLVHNYKKEFSPDAVKNYLYLMCFPPKDGREVMTHDEMVEGFDVNQINKENPLHDETLLKRLNDHYLGLGDRRNLCQEGKPMKSPLAGESMES